MTDFLNLIEAQGLAIFGSFWPLIWTLVKIIIIVLPMFGAVAYLTLWERKLIGWMHIRLGPNRVGPFGLFQPIADALKLLLKEIISPIYYRQYQARYRRGNNEKFLLQAAQCQSNPTCRLPPLLSR